MMKSVVQCANRIFSSIVFCWCQSLFLLRRAYPTYVRLVHSDVIQLFGLLVSNRTLKLSPVSNAGLPKDYPVLKTSLIPIEQLKRLRLPSVEWRRLYNDLIWCYNTRFYLATLTSVATNFSH